MRVGLIGSPGQFDYNKYSSRERYMPELFKNLKRLNPQTDKIEIKKLPFIGRAFSISIKLLFRDVSNYNIIHNISQDPIFLLKKKNAKLITTVHLSPGQLSVQAKNFKHVLWLNSVIKLSYLAIKNSDYIIANSTQTKDDIINFLKIDKNKIFITDLGIDERYAKRIKSMHRGQNIHVGYIGALVPGKQVDFGIKATNYLNDKNVIFNIWGARLDEEYFEYLIKLSSNNHNIKFEGYAPGEKLVDIYDSFDVFIFPSIYESFGLPILEAQSRGLPVIIYKYGKIPKEVRKYCFEAESPEHMAQIIEDLKENGYNEKLRKRATEYAQSFTWERCALNTFKVYKKVLSL
jgi:glycosyltransferase involved in cell wall biosynthesis